MRAYQDMVFTTAARLIGDDRQAEDIAQEVFLKAYENFDQLRTSSSAGGWLKTVSRNLSLNHIFRYRRRWRMFSEMRQDDSEEDAPEVEFAVPDDVIAGVDAGVRHGLVEDALQQLPERQRLPLVLYHFEELSYEEIAERLGVSLAKVKTDIFRARGALSKLLAQVEARAAAAHWRRGFAHWPIAARVAFLAASVGVVKVALSLVMWLSTPLDSRAPAFDLPSQLDWLQTLFVAVGSIARTVPSLWVHAGIAVLAIMYVALFGIGASAYRTMRAAH
jgi:RNA polymerase sigma-70 factor (ECF subfamily)